MAVDPQVVVNIASEFTGKKAFNEAGKATSKLDKNIKNLAKGLLAAFSVRAIVNFGKESVKAFQDAEKEAAQLRTQLDSLNLGFAAPFIGQFIDKLALATGKAGGELNAAFISLSQGTQNVTDAQKLLNVALDVSAGTSTDLKTVTTALQRAYLGDVNALARLRIGYTTANLAGRDFDKVLTEITEKFKGSSSQAADTLAGKMARLSEATEQAKEAFGAGFVKGLENTGVAVEDLQKDVISLGDAFGYAAGQATGFFSQTFNDLLKYFETDEGAIAKLARSLIKLQIDDPAKIRTAARIRRQIFRQEQENLKKNLTLTKALTKEKKDQLALDKAALALGKGEDIFDLDKIQVQAALLAKQDEINKLGVNATDQQKLQLANDLTRLSIKQTMAQLEDAIAVARAATTEKEKELAMIEVQRLAKKLNMDLEVLGVMQKQEFKLKDIEKIINSFMPKKLIDIDNLDQALLLLGKMAGLKITPSTTTTTTTTTTTPITTPTTTPITTPTTTPITTPTTKPITTPTTTPITTPTTTPTTTPITTPTTTPITTPTTTTTPTTPDTITTIINDAVAAISSSEFAGTSLANPANILFSASLTAQLEQIMAGFAETNQLAADRYTAQLEEITARNILTNNLAADRYTAMQNYYVTVNAGAIGSEDLVNKAVQDAILAIERKGDPLRYTGGL